MKIKLNRREFLRASAIAAVGVAAASCAQPAPQVIEKPVTVVVEKEVPVEKQVVQTVVVEKQVPVEKVVKETVTVKETVVVEQTKVVEATQVPAKFKEAPMLAELVKAGQLPPVDERLPQTPVVVKPIEKIGTYGGEWTMLIAKASDTKLGHAFGYSRLVGWNQEATEIVADLCESFEVVNNTDFTFHLRKGLKWSDGVEFTAEDFRFYWDDIVHNEALNPDGTNSNLMAGGEMATVTFIDAYTVRYQWQVPNFAFLKSIAAGQSVEIFAPKHYLKQFHPKYGDQAAIDQLVKDGGFQDWTALFGDRNQWYYLNNPDMPMIQPWLPTEVPPQEKLTFKRNPYYYKVDPEGNQLPYLDALVMLSTDSKLLALKTSGGDADFQPRNLAFNDITLLKDNEAAGGYVTLLWKAEDDSDMYIYPNQTCNDEVMRELNRDRRFRIALSHAIDRSEINQTLFLGYGVEQQPEILPGAPGYNADWALADTEFDIAKANGLLDEIGLKWDANHEYRLRPDGARLDIMLEDAGEQPFYADIVELMTSTWKQVGINLLYKVTERDTFRDRVVAGDAVLSVYLGQGGRNFFWEPGGTRRVPLASGSSCLWGTQYGLWFETDGAEGQEPPPEVKQVQDLASQWLIEPDDAKRAALFDQIREIYAQERFEIGTIGGLPVPVVVKNGFRNVPQEGPFSYNVGGYVGWIQPSQCWKE